MRWLTYLFILVTFSAGAETVYKIVRPDGTVEYSSEPQNGAEELQLPTLPTYEPRVPAAPPTPEPEAARQPRDARAEYRIRVTQPSEDETVFFDAAGIPVRAEVTPSIDPADGPVVVFLLDGRERARGSGTAASLVVERGTHTLVARLETPQGEVLARSEPVTFHMRQHSRRQPNPSAPSPTPFPGGAAPTFP